MSLAIDIGDVAAILLADGWHSCTRGTFSMDSYEYVDTNETVLGGGNCPLISAYGFAFNEAGLWIYGPVTSILAIKVY